MHVCLSLFLSSHPFPSLPSHSFLLSVLLPTAFYACQAAESTESPTLSNDHAGAILPISPFLRLLTAPTLLSFLSFLNSQLVLDFVAPHHLISICIYIIIHLTSYNFSITSLFFFFFFHFNSFSLHFNFFYMISSCFLSNDK